MVKSGCSIRNKLTLEAFIKKRKIFYDLVFCKPQLFWLTLHDIQIEYLYPKVIFEIDA